MSRAKFLTAVHPLTSVLELTVKEIKKHLSNTNSSALLYVDVKRFYVVLFFAQNAFLKFLVRDAFFRTNHRAIAMMFVRLAVCLGQACIVIIGCMLARI